MRSVVYEHAFDEQMRAFQPDFFLYDQFLQGIEWILGREPTYGTFINDSNVWVLACDGSYGVPNVVIYYTFNANYVYMLGVESTEPVDSDD